MNEKNSEGDCTPEDLCQKARKQYMSVLQPTILADKATREVFSTPYSGRNRFYLQLILKCKSGYYQMVRYNTNSPSKTCMIF